MVEGGGASNLLRMPRGTGSATGPPLTVSVVTGRLRNLNSYERTRHLIENKESNFANPVKSMKILELILLTRQHVDKKYVDTNFIANEEGNFGEPRQVCENWGVVAANPSSN